ncbi:MAG: hypothetical protein HQL11_04085 [Candidatus Omnitrophica bacterium]|nr:hypothetical protein [Candidatus Omnitrophota bacterium]
MKLKLIVVAGILSGVIFAGAVHPAFAGEAVRTERLADGSWQLLVNEEPYFIKGTVFHPVKIGESPGEATMRDWMLYDDDRNGVNDAAYESWVDANRNEQRDPDEPPVGDFGLLEELGANTVRLYHVASDHPSLGRIYKDNPSTKLQYDHPVNKALLRELFASHGIRVVMGSFAGAWTIGSGAGWDKGTDFTDPVHRENIRKSVRAMVMDNKDEPYVLLWLLGNENNLDFGLHRSNSQERFEEYAAFVNELCEMIHELDPEHPVALCLGDPGDYALAKDLDVLAKHAPAIDLLGFNSYRNRGGFGSLWMQVKRHMDRPVFLTEFGMTAYLSDEGEAGEHAAQVVQRCWENIVRQAAASGWDDRRWQGNSVGGFVFDWLDRWYMDGTPFAHNPGTRHSGISPDGLLHEEWWGILSMGNGSDWLKRQKRPAYDYLKSAWNQTNTADTPEG